MVKGGYKIIEIIYFDKHPCEEERESFARRDFVDRQGHVVSVQREGVSLITSEFTHLKSLETVSSANFKIATSLDPSLTVDILPFSDSHRGIFREPQIGRLSLSLEITENRCLRSTRKLYH